MKPQRGQAGFSIFESVLATGLFTMVVGFTFSVLSIARESWSTGTSISDIQFESERVLRRLTSELRHAIPDQVTIANTNDGIRFAVPADGTDAGTTVLSDTTKRLEFDRFIEYAYDAATNRVLRRELDSTTLAEVVAPVPMANRVQAFRVDGDAGLLTKPKAVTVTVTSEKALRPQAPATSLRRFTAKEQVRLRNDEDDVAIVYGPAPTTNPYATATETTVTTTITTGHGNNQKTTTTTVPGVPTS